MKFKIVKNLILALAATASSAAASTITIPLNYTTDASDNTDLTLSGTLVIDTNAAGAANRDQTNSRGTALPAWISSLSLNITDSDISDGDDSATYTKSDFDVFAWEPTTPGSVNFDNDLVSQFNDISFLSFTPGFSSTQQMQQHDGQNEFTLTSTPSPLLFIGILPLLTFYRKLKFYK